MTVIEVCRIQAKELDTIPFSYLVSWQDSTKHSPFYLVYGRHPRLPIEFTMKCPGASERCDKPEDGLQQTIHECNIKVFNSDV